jgi:hypothetical protein
VGDRPDDFSFKINKHIEPKLVAKFTILAFAEACKKSNPRNESNNKNFLYQDKTIIKSNYNTNHYSIKYLL